MKHLSAIIIILIISLPCTAQKYWEDSTYQAQAKKASAERKLARAKQDAYWDSINNKGNAEFKAEMIKKYGKQKGASIADGQIKVGYTKEMVSNAWGAASRVYHTTTKKGISESWYYNKRRTTTTFINNLLVSITE